MKKQGATFQKIIVPAVIAAIVIYLIFSAWNGLRDPYSFVIVYADTMEESVEAEGWVVRSEMPVSGGGSGLIQLKRNEGEKVAEGAAIAMVYQDENYVDNQEKLLRTKSNLGALQYATYDGSPSGTSLEGQMMSALSQLRTASSSGDYSNLAEETETYRKLVLRREFLVSSEAAEQMNAAAAVLYTDYETLLSNQSGTTEITASRSGMFSSHLDGYETLLSPDSLVGLLPEGLAAFDQLVPKSAEGSLGKLVTNPVWYYAVSLPSRFAHALSPGQEVSVYFDALSKALPMEVESVGEIQDDRVVAVLRSAQNEHEAGDLRRESCRLILESEEGILIPKEALRVCEGENGVFVSFGYNAVFRPVKILAENDDYYLVKANPKDENDKRILRSGDEVVLASAELYDGKVVH
ncbi:MAG: HlyD family efflux transporter periplasmic adaptor subunit [Bacillota bacterium]|nr:HlyD family efflux transporter periplasmic adaptor subunit [Bacillota bacterium]